MESSFFEKLKKGMGAEEETEMEKEEKIPPVKNTKQKKAPKKTKKAEIKTVSIELEDGEEPEEEKAVEKEEPKTKVSKEEKWPEPEGQLAIDVYQTESELVIQSAIAGVRPDNLDVSIEKDLLTIRGRREKPSQEEGDYFSQECYWGPFSREIILPVEVDPGRVEATLTEGVLTIRIPKIERDKKRRIAIKG